MKIVRSVYSLIIGIVFVVSLLVVYNLDTTTVWGYKRLIEKFELNISLKERTDIEGIIFSLKQYSVQCKNLKLKNVEFVSKENIWEKVNDNEELRYILTILSRNPFPDIIKISFAQYNSEEFDNLLKKIKEIPSIKEIIFDKNISTYLERGVKIIRYFTIIKYILFILFFCFAIYFLFLLVTGEKICWIESIIFTIFYGVVIFFNNKLISLVDNRFLSSSIKIAWYIGIYLTTLLLVHLINKNEKV